MRTSRAMVSVTAAAALLLSAAGCTGEEKAEEIASVAQDESVGATVEKGNVKRCDEVGLEGREYGAGGSTYADPADVLTLGEEDGRGDKRLDIETVADGHTVNGVVLKGGPAANVYTPGEDGMAERAPWEDLQAPENPGGNVPAIGHWFACVTTSEDTASEDAAATGEQGSEEVRTITVAIVDGELARGPEDVVSVEVGQPIRLVISTDESHEVTVPDFDAKLRVSAAEPGTLEFTADEAGTSTVEMEGAALFKLRVA